MYLLLQKRKNHYSSQHGLGTRDFPNADVRGSLFSAGNFKPHTANNSPRADDQRLSVHPQMKSLYANSRQSTLEARPSAAK